ncbi:GntR family transcriptional regulator [Bordetella tumulicola]|uniref:GntR family transcriptional regulator n=1 Tax=Bordetella tumulicola TaxID=1649133 RepID=UPI0039F026E5
MDDTGMTEKANVNSKALDSLPTRIAASLAERIIRGALKPGDRVRQDEVASDFNASHVPVREAFRQLESRGLLVSRVRKGVYVSPLDQASLVEITRMRAALEVLALRYAIPNLSNEDIALAEKLSKQADSSKDMSTWEDANRRFHLCLYRPCEMPRVLHGIETLHEARLRYMYATATIIDWNPTSQDEHREIIAAVKARDIARACSLLEKHIVEAGDVLLAASGALSA